MSKQKMDVAVWPDWFGPDDVADWMSQHGLTVEYPASDPGQPWGLLTAKGGEGAGLFRAFLSAHRLGNEWVCYAVAECFRRDDLSVEVPLVVEMFEGPDAPVMALKKAREAVDAFRRAVA